MAWLQNEGGAQADDPGGEALLFLSTVASTHPGCAKNGWTHRCLEPAKKLPRHQKQQTHNMSAVVRRTCGCPWRRNNYNESSRMSCPLV
eukprot:6074184-Prorocentrum_lima.AAC.1